MSTKFYQSRPCFVDDVTKNIWCVLGFAVPIAVHFKNANAKFHKVVHVTTLFRWAGKHLNYSIANLFKHCVLNVIKIDGVLWMIWQKHFYVFFSVYSVVLWGQAGPVINLGISFPQGFCGLSGRYGQIKQWRKRHLFQIFHIYMLMSWVGTPDASWVLRQSALKSGLKVDGHDTTRWR